MSWVQMSWEMDLKITKYQFTTPFRYQFTVSNDISEFKAGFYPRIVWILQRVKMYCSGISDEKQKKVCNNSQNIHANSSNVLHWFTSILNLRLDILNVQSINVFCVNIFNHTRFYSPLPVIVIKSHQICFDLHSIDTNLLINSQWLLQMKPLPCFDYFVCDNCYRNVSCLKHSEILHAG